MDNIDRIQCKINTATTELLGEIVQRLIKLETDAVLNDSKHYSSKACTCDMIEGMEDRLMEALSVLQSSFCSDLTPVHTRHNELVEYLLGAVVQDAALSEDEDYPEDEDYKAVVRRLRALRLPRGTKFDTIGD